MRFTLDAVSLMIKGFIQTSFDRSDTGGGPKVTEKEQCTSDFHQ